MLGIPRFDMSDRARSTMGDGRNEDDGVLIDVTGLSIDELSKAVPLAVRGQALDRILADNSVVYNGFNNNI
jgi:hypothetical protein